MLSQLKLAAPVRDILRQMKGSVDQMASGIIRVVPTYAEAARSEKDSLDKSFHDVITVFSDLVYNGDSDRDVRSPYRT